MALSESFALTTADNRVFEFSGLLDHNFQNSPRLFIALEKTAVERSLRPGDSFRNDDKLSAFDKEMDALHRWYAAEGKDHPHRATKPSLAVELEFPISEIRPKTPPNTTGERPTQFCTVIYNVKKIVPLGGLSTDDLRLILTTWTHRDHQQIIPWGEAIKTLHDMAIPPKPLASLTV